MKPIIKIISVFILGILLSSCAKEKDKEEEFLRPVKHQQIGYPWKRKNQNFQWFC